MVRTTRSTAPTATTGSRRPRPLFSALLLLLLTAWLPGACDDPSGPVNNSNVNNANNQNDEIDWVIIQAGQFLMGRDDTTADQAPAHLVTISQPFRIARTEITQAQWERLRPRPLWWVPDCPSCPVHGVTWTEAADFCDAIGGRLPTEIEWEYAARAGTTTLYPCGDDPACVGAIAWTAADGEGVMHPVGQKAPNAWGLHDMTGNAWEWVSDWYHQNYEGAPEFDRPWLIPAGTERVLRGGGTRAQDGAWQHLSSFRKPWRFYDIPDPMMGLRCVLPPPGECEAPTTLCRGFCVELATDEEHCGACGNRCGAGFDCVDAACACMNDRQECEDPAAPGERACVDIYNDDAHCGECGNACPLNHRCEGGECVRRCQLPWTECDGHCVRLAEHALHCGVCGIPCPADHLCRDSSCEPFTCPAGFVPVRPGLFTMGSPTDEPEHHEGREFERDVWINHVLCVAALELTQGEFEALLGYNPSYFPECGADCPVERVTWHEAAAFANARSLAEGLSPCYACSGAGRAVVCAPTLAPGECDGYRLPTDAEWEYVARAGTTTAFFSGDCLFPLGPDPEPALEAIGWYALNSDRRTHPGGLKQDNPWGLFDTAGNVAEWCHDGLMDSDDFWPDDPVGPLTGDRVLRGGDNGHRSFECRSAAKQVLAPEAEGQDFAGVRLVRTMR